MKFNKLNMVIVLGLVAIIGILVIQLLWMKQAFSAEEKKFSQKVHITLLQVVNKLYEYNHAEFPLNNPIQKVSNDYYIVNVNNDFEAEILEYCLKTEFQKANLLTDFEYAVYKCESDEMVYGNYVSFTDKPDKKHSVYFPKQKNLIYYFAIRFPNENTYLVTSLKYWWILSLILILILIIYVYSIITIIQQRKYSELQKDFINNMTHEFKTPLSSILIASNYLSRQPSIQADDKMEKYASIIINQSQKLNNHIEKILNIARSDDAPLKLDIQNIPLITTLQEVKENIALKYENVEISLESGKAEYYIKADAFHFTNLVYNILDNSIKYSAKNPGIVIRISESGQDICLDFRDQGIGIPAKKLAYIFDKFYRVSDHHVLGAAGFGLGLYYVKKVCDLHHWKISATNNTPEPGITIRVSIPQIL
ncbi:MAG: HAMP domain-containing histidine kinase [Bacteroidetes bacterium]|nr:HAMP domain-containing histidine kinase [Bacteroidota bacterium]